MFILAATVVVFPVIDPTMIRQESLLVRTTSGLSSSRETMGLTCFRR